MKIDYSNIYESLNTLCIEAGTTITQVCREANVSRSTPEVWKEKNPKTLEIIGAMLAVIEKKQTKKDADKAKIMLGARKQTRTG